MKKEIYSVQTAQLWYSMAMRIAWLCNSLSVTAQLWNSMTVKQHGYKEALGLGNPGENSLERGPSLARQLWYAPVCSILPCASLLCSADTALVFQLQLRKPHLQPSVERKNALFKPQRVSLSMVSDWFILVQMRTPNTQFNWSKMHCSEWSEWSHSGWWRCWWRYSYTALIGQG